ncbi:MAG: MBOAT family protein, partial [Planctomycetes bacterium]|nr:MBOAT family protein [Planctomycetota bacterium]
MFLLVVWSLYWAIGQRRAQNLLLLSASYFFYGWWDYRFCGLMLGSSLLDYFIGRSLDRTENVKKRKALLTASVVANVGVLCVFKYSGFFLDNLRVMTESMGLSLGDLTFEIILPVGISFYTFQTMSYTIDIYRRQLKSSENLIDYLGFVSFFPQLVAGPIERASNLLPQFHKDRKFDYDFAVSGCRLLLWGFFKKLVIADRLSEIVDKAYSAPNEFQGPFLAFATVCFAFQIYCDFSAYSDMAIGTARLFGISLMRNFNYPYFSQSLGEFWRRWHISLSSWFRDYVYLPLGGSRVSGPRRFANVMITFLVSGLWHGAAWRFLFWGGINGAGVAWDSQRAARRKARGVPDRTPEAWPLEFARGVYRTGLTFAIVCLGWVFFRADTFSDAFVVIGSTFSDCLSGAGYAALRAELRGDTLVTTACLLMFVIFEWVQKNKECPLEIS